jgi:2-polyprenyl-3-methyl-5-hydroxy-6-metoxy-1,4-benzoquinol methylase
MTGSRAATHFEHLYQSNPDPWGFQTSAYEQTKYRQTLSALGHRRFTLGLEVGCSIGVLTRELAVRCESLLAVDIVEDPLEAARLRCADQPQVQFRRMQVPVEWPEGCFDLMVFSEVLYFLSAAEIRRCARRVLSSLSPVGMVVLVNWLGPTDDPTPGNEAAEVFIGTTAGRLRVDRHEQHEGYRLDVLMAE